MLMMMCLLVAHFWPPFQTSSHTGFAWLPEHHTVAGIQPEPPLVHPRSAETCNRLSVLLNALVRLQQRLQTAHGTALPRHAPSQRPQQALVDHTESLMADVQLQCLIIRTILDNEQRGTPVAADDRLNCWQSCNDQARLTPNPEP